MTGGLGVGKMGGIGGTGGFGLAEEVAEGVGLVCELGCGVSEGDAEGWGGLTEGEGAAGEGVAEGEAEGSGVTGGLVFK